MNDYNRYLLLLALLFTVGVLALFQGIMEPDGALYAAVAKTMVLRNDWVNLYARNLDWLDKPHLPFWLAALSFKLFGIHAFAYKLPSFLIGWWGVFYIVQFGRQFYTKALGYIAAVIYVTAFHIAISTFDVRAEIYLATFTFAGIYYYHQAYLSKWFYVIPGSFFIACAVMSKGIFVMIPILGSFVLFWLLTKQYRELIKWKWWLAIALIGLFILPELYCLYRQFDLHPEKWVFGRQGVSGIRFFFWDSQFGRFFNTGPIKGKGDPTFFLHTTLWAFLPWSLLLYAALYTHMKQLRWHRENSATSLVLFSALITFLLFSFSKFQLPHYIVIIFPQFALLTAGFILHLQPKQQAIWLIIQRILGAVIIALLVLITFLFGMAFSYGIALGLVLLAGLLYWMSRHWERVVQLVIGGAGLTSLFMVYLYSFFYPELLRYQSGMLAGKWISRYYPNEETYVFNLDDNSNSIAFYAPGEVHYMYGEDQLREKLSPGHQQFIFTSEENLRKLRQHFQVELISKFDHFHITKLKMAFLNQHSRPGTLSSFCLAKISR